MGAPSGELTQLWFREGRGGDGRGEVWEAGEGEWGGRLECLHSTREHTKQSSVDKEMRNN